MEFNLNLGDKSLDSLKMTPKVLKDCSAEISKALSKHLDLDCSDVKMSIDNNRESLSIDEETEKQKEPEKPKEPEKTKETEKNKETEKTEKTEKVEKQKEPEKTEKNKKDIKENSNYDSSKCDAAVKKNNYFHQCKFSKLDTTNYCKRHGRDHNNGELKFGNFLDNIQPKKEKKDEKEKKEKKEKKQPKIFKFQSEDNTYSKPYNPLKCNAITLHGVKYEKQCNFPKKEGRIFCGQHQKAYEKNELKNGVVPEEFKKKTNKNTKKISEEKKEPENILIDINQAIPKTDFVITDTELEKENFECEDPTNISSNYNSDDTEELTLIPIVKPIDGYLEKESGCCYEIVDKKYKFIGVLNEENEIYDGEDINELDGVDED